MTPNLVKLKKQAYKISIPDRIWAYGFEILSALFPISSGEVIIYTIK